MSIDISLIPQERIKDLVSTLDNIQNNISNNIVHKSGNETISGTKKFTGKIVGDNSIEWGGTNLLSNVSPTDAGCLDDFGHNKAAYWGGLIDAEYTVDGKTWIDYGLSSYQKWALTTANGTDVIVGKNTKKASDGTLTNDNIANVRARITLHIKDANDRSRFYSALRKIVLNVSTNGASKCKVKVLTRTLENYTSGTDTWVDRGTYEVSGYSGWNSIPFINNLGGYDNQKGYNADLRLEFWSENIATTSRTSCLSIKDIRLIGVTNWIADDFAKTGHLYSISDSKIATFPNTINFSTPAASDNSTKGATTEWVNSPELSTNIVHKTGDETITGTKTFTSPIQRTASLGGGGNFLIKLTDSNGKGSVNQSSYYANGVLYNRLNIINSSSGKEGYIEIQHNDDGEYRGVIGGNGTNLSLTRAVSSTTENEIPTKGWVNNPATSTNVVHRSGNETITGLKNFTNGSDVTTDSSEPFYITQQGISQMTSHGLTATFSNIVIKGQNEEPIALFGGQMAGSGEYRGMRFLGYGSSWVCPFYFCVDSSNNPYVYIYNKLVKGFVTETWNSGTSWYRVWSDGWIEQGGTASGGTAFTFLKAFTNTNYIIIPAITSYSSINAMGADLLFIKNKKTTDCTIGNTNTTYNLNFMWYACGY